jgi:LPS sulfotransferase NodH
VIAFILANERSGTHFLRSALESSGAIIAPGEICNAAAEVEERTELSFFEFRARAIAGDKKIAFPTPANQGELLDQYLAFIDEHRRKSGRECILVDVKYSHIHNFNGFWWDLFSPPFLIEYLNQRDIPIIHLVRTNAFQTAFSGIYAEATGVWRAARFEDTVVSPLKIDVGALKNEANKIEANVQIMRRWLTDSRALEVNYDAVVGDKSSDALNEIMKFLCLDICQKFSSDFVKTTPQYSSVIENFEDVVALLQPEAAAKIG